MLKRLQQKWKVSSTQFFWILCVFAITGTTTAWVSKVITRWVGFTEATHWAPKLGLRLLILIFGYQIILLTVAALLGQFPFFWNYEKKILRRMGMLSQKRSEAESRPGGSKVENQKAQSAAESCPGGSGDQMQRAASKVQDWESGVKTTASVAKENGLTQDPQSAAATPLPAHSVNSANSLNAISTLQNSSNLQLPTYNFQPPTSNKINIAVFASGAGSNAAKLIEHFRDSDAARVALVVCNKPEAGVLPLAQAAGVETLLISRERFMHGDGYLPELQARSIGFLVLAGFLWKLPQPLVDAYPRRIVNIHPALLPSWGGKGMWGQHVHSAVIAAGEVQSGITIHYVDEEYDRGDVVFQTACPVLPGDTPEALAARIHTLEHLHYPRVVEELVQALPRI